MTTVFLSSPYTHPDPDVVAERVRRTGEAFAWLFRQGYFPMSPILQCHPVAIREGLPTNANAWCDWNRGWIMASDAVAFLHIDGWQNSQGMGYERQWAAGMPQATLEPHNGSFRWVGAGEEEGLLSRAHSARCGIGPAK